MPQLDIKIDAQEANDCFQNIRKNAEKNLNPVQHYEKLKEECASLSKSLEAKKRELLIFKQNHPTLWRL